MVQPPACARVTRAAREASCRRLEPREAATASEREDHALPPRPPGTLRASACARSRCSQGRRDGHARAAAEDGGGSGRDDGRDRGGADHLHGFTKSKECLFWARHLEMK